MLQLADSVSKWIQLQISSIQNFQLFHNFDCSLGALLRAENAVQTLRVYVIITQYIEVQLVTAALQDPQFLSFFLINSWIYHALLMTKTC